MITITAAGQFLAVVFPYSRLDEFKALVPHGYRWWDKDKRTWLVNPPAFDAIADAWGTELQTDYDAWRLICPAPIEQQSMSALARARDSRAAKQRYGRGQNGGQHDGHK